MTTHQFATFLNKLCDAFGDTLKTPNKAEFAEIAAVFNEVVDLPLREFLRSVRAPVAPVGKKAQAAVDLPTLVAQIRAVRESPAGSEPPHVELPADKLNNTHLREILKAFGEKATTGVADNLTKVRQLLRPGAAHEPRPEPATPGKTSPVVIDPQAVETGVALYNALQADRKLSISDVRAGFEPIRAYSKPVIEEISRRIGLTPAGSQATILDRLLDVLESIKLDQHRADRILAPTGS